MLLRRDWPAHSMLIDRLDQPFIHWSITSVKQPALSLGHESQHTETKNTVNTPYTINWLHLQMGI